MKKYQAAVIGLEILVWGVLAAVKINFAPTMEQLEILNRFHLYGYFYLWELRGLTILILAVTMWFWGRLVEKFDKTLNLWSVTAIITTPVFLVLAMVHPLVSVKLLILVLLAYIGIKYLGKKWWLVLGFLAIFTIGYNFFVLGNRPAILNQFSLKDAQGEVTTRMTEEDSLYTKISLPLWWRRIAYNKFYFIYKNAVGEILPFWDLESVFFQEVHPLDQKSVVMFYWIEMYVFIFGIYFLVKNKNLNLNKFIILGILLSWTDFVFSEGSPYLRLILVIFPFSLVIAKGAEELKRLSIKKYMLAKIVGVLVVIIMIYGVLVNYYDLTVRTQKWFDNRPLAFQFWYENLQKLDLAKYKKIQISSLVDDSKAYCYFYLGKVCDQSKFVFKSFDLSTEKPEINSVYAGFAGEFVGPRFKNDIDPNWEKLTKDRGFEFIGEESLTDTVAYQYGNDIGIAIKK